LLELLGIDPDDELHGSSFLGLLDGGDYRPSEEIFGELTYHDYYDPRRCVRTDRHKLIANFSNAYAYMDPSQSWHRRCTPRVEPMAYHPPVELYDLAADPHELTDLAAEPAHAATVEELLARLHTWMAATGDPLLDGAVTSPLHRRTRDRLVR
jgi:arylsulfatase A-like enzyme